MRQVQVIENITYASIYFGSFYVAQLFIQKP